MTTHITPNRFLPQWLPGVFSARRTGSRRLDSGNDNRSNGGRRFTAFISYKHVSSTGFAAQLERALKGYAKPLLARPRRIFRDEKHFAPGIDLPRLIEEALKDSEFLLLLASPESARSPWVQDELDLWCRVLKRQERLIVILLGGDIKVDSESKQIDWSGTDALPPFMEQHLATVPLYLDLRKLARLEDISLDDPDFKRAINGIAARFRGIDPNDMLGEEIRQYRRNLRLRNGAVAALAMLTILSGTFWFLADSARREAIASKREEEFTKFILTETVFDLISNERFHLDDLLPILTKEKNRLATVLKPMVEQSEALEKDQKELMLFMLPNMGRNDLAKVLDILVKEWRQRSSLTHNFIDKLLEAMPMMDPGAFELFVNMYISETKGMKEYRNSTINRLLLELRKRINTEDPNSSILLAKVLSLINTKKSLVEAEKTLRDSLKTNRFKPKLYIALSDFLKSTGRELQASVIIDDVITAVRSRLKDSNDPEKQKKIQSYKFKYQEGITIYVPKRSQAPNLYYDLALLLDYSGRNKEAKENYGFAYKLGVKENNFFIDYMGLLTKTGDCDQAKNLLKSALSELPKNEELLKYSLECVDSFE
uniref:TIR domain-containing protein n=1 Tax=Candidatus Kentrum sp. DK TaxID=2126562 RepID=A0A450T938_9GAMM|nr:MAG: TIR domain-containing protein [Candidatus Kentron sp. DK]